MEQLTDERLTLFLAKMFDGQQKNLLRPAERSTIPGAVQYGHHEEDLWFLETRLGSIWNGTSYVIVYQGEDKTKMSPVWRMSVDRWMDRSALEKTDGLTNEIVLGFINDSRRHGFERAVNVITRLNPGLDAKDKLPFCIFTIPKQELAVVSKFGQATGKLHYEEGIEDTLERFGGAEEVKFVPAVAGRKSIELVKIYVQGGRI
jgi:hypothetical protein